MSNSKNIIKKFYSNYEYNIHYVMSFHPNIYMVSLKYICNLYGPSNRNNHKIFLNYSDYKTKNEYGDNVTIRKWGNSIYNRYYYFKNEDDYNRFILENV